MKILFLDSPNEGYSIRSDGVVFGISGKPLKQRKSKCGYYRVRLRKGWENVHRLLAIYFLDNPQNLETVNHKDSNKENNSLSNLEWISRKDNLYHAMDNHLHNWGRTKVKDSLGMIYNSQAEAARSLGCCQGNIKRAINTGGTYYNRKWSYI
jgi:hypothetical protein